MISLLNSIRTSPFFIVDSCKILYESTLLILVKFIYSHYRGIKIRTTTANTMCGCVRSKEERGGECEQNDKKPHMNDNGRVI